MEKQRIVADEQWHAMEADAVYTKLKSTADGLGNEEATRRLVYYGENKLPVGKRVTLWRIIMHQLLNPLIFILVAAAIASVLIGEGKDAVFIFIVIFINSALGTYQEFSAERSASSLQGLMKITARVRREGRDEDIPAEKLVPGDMILLESGLKVPADLRLIEAQNLEIDESFLTGESLAVHKHTNTLATGTGLAERKNMAFGGSTILKGRALGLVVCTGTDTQVGRISKHVAESLSAKPPLVQRMERFIKQISIFILALSVILAVVLRMQGMDLAAIFFFVVALAVSAIPEGLPVALTVALSIATRRMAARNVIVRRLTSVESLGSCTVIASDKTGTLTLNEQTAKVIVLPDGKQFDISGQGYNGEGEVLEGVGSKNRVSHGHNPVLDELAEAAIFANEAELSPVGSTWEFHGDAMDVALLGMAWKLKMEPGQWQKDVTELGMIPYESERNYSALYYNHKGSQKVAAKGAVETILDFCHDMAAGDKTSALDSEKILAETSRLAKEGYRVLAFAGGTYSGPSDKKAFKDEDIPPLTLYGLVGFIDPLRPEAKNAVLQCRKAGIKVIMITGDHPETAGSIARDLGFAKEDNTVVTGNMLAGAGANDSPDYEALVASSTVFARVSPAQKHEIVDVLIREGEFVAVTGDGVNDASALKRANIGVAMGSGTDVAKEVGDMIVVDDNFSSIVAGVEEGRFAYDNVRKVIYLLISTGAAEVLLFLASIAAGLPLPLLAVQLLWLNLVTNGIQDVALAFEGGEPGAMQRGPRKTNERIFDPLMLKQVLTSSFTMATIVFALWYWLNKFTGMDETHARDLILLLMVCMQNFHAFNARSEKTSTFRVPLRRNLVLVFGVMAAQGIHILSMHIPFMQSILRVEPVTFNEWVYILLLAIPMLLAMELFKFVRNKRGQNSKSGKGSKW